ncbi:hypothetical protein UFOVP132_224 [uncultured Caudovirales phage]|uniref:Uncharacterized protein n=1 Tax=uncultured Caudovirales phage TaxID=2100421 RepID=A0A6J5LB55_9CAUD|nr:hypothetical protein UFOVP132_224 [uncultured Caudovirales phage]
MTDKTFTFTIEQIKEIYRAGIRRGSDEQCAYDWGTRASGGEYDECIEVIHTIVNEGKDVWDDPDYSDWKVIESWFKETK